LISFLPAATVLVAVPGPDSLLVIRNAALGGPWRGLVTTAGTVTGLLCWLVAAVVGVAGAVRASPVADQVLRYLGAAYLGVFGIDLLAGRSDSRPSRSLKTRRERPDSARATYTTAMMTNLLNPKIGVLFASVLPAFVAKGTSIAAGSLELGALFVAQGTLWLIALAFLSPRFLVC
jgi:threonine/homoserine/homoserine lactone efflux protein